MRPRASGKFLFVGNKKLYLRGVTYGTFATRDGVDFPAHEIVAVDFQRMREHGITAVRTYSEPPAWLLDSAAAHGLLVLVGLPWEQHVTFLDDSRIRRVIESRVREGIRRCAGHPAVAAYAIGNEIPSSVVRWHGRRPVERFLARLGRIAREEDPGRLVTYVNYPTTEYLELPFADFLSFNVFLEREDAFEAYVARLQNLAGDRPLVLTELGLDSGRHGEGRQAELVSHQLESAFRQGCAGAFVFSWTDEWHRGGEEVAGWSFGLVDAERRPKPVLAAVGRAHARARPAVEGRLPRISVVFCTHNGERRLARGLEAAKALDYPDYEILVVNDGSSDRTGEIAAEAGVRVVALEENGGLARARNRGIQEARGEIVAFLDDDAWPDPDWLTHLARTFLFTAHVGVGGPNVPPPDEGLTASCVARSPGGPIHVLLSDREAEHVPGCNMAFRKRALEEVGGFDEQFRSAGDDVDLCWRVQQRGWTLGFNPAAMVWHRRRASVTAYLRQQYGYGKAEALLEAKWPEKYNRGGHLTWTGRVYNGLTPAWRRWRVYYGTWGTGLFQPLVQRPPSLVASVAAMPEWYLFVALLSALSALGLLWPKLFLALPVLVAALAVPCIQAALAASRVRMDESLPGLVRLRARALIAILHLLQPAARLAGRLRHGLSPWRGRRTFGLAIPAPRSFSVWSEVWRSGEERLGELELVLRSAGASVLRGGPFDRWDLQARTGTFGVARLRIGLEEHGRGRQLIRFRLWPRPSRGGAALAIGSFALGIAAWDAATAAGSVLALAGILVALLVVRDCSSGMAAALRVLSLQARSHDGDYELGPAGQISVAAAASGNGSVAGRDGVIGGAAENGSRPPEGKEEPAREGRAPTR